MKEYAIKQNIDVSDITEKSALLDKICYKPNSSTTKTSEQINNTHDNENIPYPFDLNKKREKSTYKPDEDEKKYGNQIFFLK